MPQSNTAQNNNTVQNNATRGEQGDIPIIAVAAMARNRVIGDGDRLPWSLAGDLARLKTLTMGKPLIMGRRTWLSLDRVLPGRGHIILTRQHDFTAEGAKVAHNEDEAIALAHDWIKADAERGREIIIFGGGEIYTAFLGRTTRIELTEVDLTPQGTAYFPKLNPDDWHEIGRQSIPSTASTPAYDFVTLVRAG